MNPSPSSLNVVRPCLLSPLEGLHYRTLALLLQCACLVSCVAPHSGRVFWRFSSFSKRLCCSFCFSPLEGKRDRAPQLLRCYWLCKTDVCSPPRTTDGSSSGSVISGLRSCGPASPISTSRPHDLSKVTRALIADDITQLTALHAYSFLW